MQKKTGGRLSRMLRRKPKPLWLVIVCHILALVVALLLYALPHHVITRKETAVGIQSSRSDAVTAMAGQTPEPVAPEPTAAATVEPEATLEAEPVAAAQPTDAPGSFRVKFADKFTSGAVESTDTTYRSANVNLTVSTTRYQDSDCHVADVYVADIGYLVTAMADDQYGRGYREWPVEFAQRYNALITLSGDYYGGRSDGVVIRNGMLYRDKFVSTDVCVLYWDGTMETLEAYEFNVDAAMENGAYQAWNFGPILLDKQGQPMTEFNSDVLKSNPRAAIGYYEPGHYCLVMVDGRTAQSDGLTMEELSNFMYSLGCTRAYNLDGGQTAALVKANEIYGKPYKGGRDVSDVIMVLDYMLEQ